MDVVVGDGSDVEGEQGDGNCKLSRRQSGFRCEVDAVGDDGGGGPEATVMRVFVANTAGMPSGRQMSVSDRTA